jgi:hypothetical protein
MVIDDRDDDHGDRNDYDYRDDDSHRDDDDHGDSMLMVIVVTSFA